MVPFRTDKNTNIEEQEIKGIARETHSELNLHAVYLVFLFSPLQQFVSKHVLVLFCLIF